MDYAVRLIHISKRFGPVRALSDINLDIAKGETLAIVGENGAGKSTLMKILTGAYSLEEGEIEINGKIQLIKSTSDAKDLGISQVYQHSEIVPELTVLENIFLGEKDFANKGLISWKKLEQSASTILNKYNINVKSHALMKDVSVAGCQLVSVAKVLQRDPQVIIFDEPTAVLADREVEILFEIIAELKKQNKTIIYISHRLEEIFKVADRIAVMRDGHLVTQLENLNITSEMLISHMLGRKLSSMFPPKITTGFDKIIMEVDKLTTEDVENISFNLYKGEILGVAGLVGSGRTELAKAIFGTKPIKSGTVSINGKKLKLSGPKEVIRNGLFLAPEDRKGEGLILGRNIRENISMSNLKLVTRHGFLRKKKELLYSRDLINKLSIKAPSTETIAGNLSGGNQQKVVVAKSLMANPDILIADEPTQGIDVGAKAEIYNLINGLASNGMSIIFISSEIEELMGLCNRIIVMHAGCITGELSGMDVKNSKKILSLMYKVTDND